MTFSGHKSAITALNYDHDGVRLVSGSKVKMSITIKRSSYSFQQINLLYSSHPNSTSILSFVEYVFFITGHRCDRLGHHQ